MDEIDLRAKSDEGIDESYVDNSDGEIVEPTQYTKEPKPRAVIYWGFIILFLVLTVLCVIAALVTSIFSQITLKDKTPNEDTANRNIDIDVPINAIFTAMTAGFLALFVMTFLSLRVVSAPVGINTPEGSKMYSIALDIRKGAIAFMKKEFQVLIIFVIGVVIVLIPLEILTTGIKTANYVPETAICFVIGAATSALTSIIGMNIATLGNVRTTNACRTSMSTGLRVAFNAGTVMGLSVVGLGLVMLSVMYLVFQNLSALAGFGFGASSIALFARVGGGIYTKAADVGADLVGKVEANIPEDDPRNPATIADNVGDNVGDVAGMGADLFESYVGSIIAACTLGGELFSTAGIAAPFYLAAGGILCSIIGSSLVSTREKNNASDDDLQNSLLWAIRRGIFFAAGLNVLVGGLTIFLLFKPHPQAWPIFLCFVIGLVAGVLIGLSTEYFTSFAYRPTRGIAKAGVTGPATVIIEGLSMGMISSIFPVAIIVVSIIACVLLGNLAGSQSQAEVGPAGVYGIAIASVGMLSTLGVTLATDAYGPVADNAGGLAEMAHLPAEIRDRTDALDALGNTTAATGKGFAIGSAVLTALALMNAYSRSAGIQEINVIKANVMAGILFGALLPFVFAALTMKAVGSSAMTIIKEVRRQFKEIDGLLEGRPGVVADHQRCVALCTLSSLKHMIAPGVLAVLAPLIVGILPGGIEMLGGLLAGSLSSGFLLAVTMANAGGAWDNAKKYVEAGKMVDDEGVVQGKGSEVHKAAVTGDTVGDPFKDTSGPALNILIKLMSIISLVMAPRIRLLPYQQLDLFS